MIQVIKHFPTASREKLQIRLLESGDADNLIQIFTQMGSESRFKRFLQTMEHVTPAQVEREANHIIEQIPAHGNGLIAIQNGQPLGVARYVKLDDHKAEIAVSVIDSAQGQGVGSQLLPLLSELAYDNGIMELVGTVSNNNEPMWHLLNKLPYPIERYSEGGESAFTLDLK